MESKQLIQEVEKMLVPLIEELGYELIETEYTCEGGRWILRLYIDKEGGVSVGDCTQVSRKSAAILDVEDILPGKFYLEVSSPGLSRPLRRVKDFQKYVTFIVTVKTTEKIENKKKFKGILKSVDDEQITIIENDNEYQIPHGKILKARLEEEQGGRSDV